MAITLPMFVVKTMFMGGGLLLRLFPAITLCQVEAGASVCRHKTTLGFVIFSLAMSTNAKLPLWVLMQLEQERLLQNYDQNEKETYSYFMETWQKTVKALEADKRKAWFERAITQVRHLERGNFKSSCFFMGRIYLFSQEHWENIIAYRAKETEEHVLYNVFASTNRSLIDHPAKREKI